MEIQKCYYVRQYIKHLIAAIYFFFIHLSDTEPAERNCFRSAFGLDMNKSFVFCSVFKLRPQWQLHHVTCLCDSSSNDLGKESVLLVLGSFEGRKLVWGRVYASNSNAVLIFEWVIRPLITFTLITEQFESWVVDSKTCNRPHVKWKPFELFHVWDVPREQQVIQAQAEKTNVCSEHMRTMWVIFVTKWSKVIIISLCKLLVTSLE